MFLQIYVPWFLLSHTPTSAQFNWGKWKGNKRMTGSKEGWILGVSQGKAGWLVACLSSWGKTTRRGNNEENYFGRFRSDRENYNLHIIIVQWLRWEIWNYESLTDWLTHRVTAGMDGKGWDLLWVLVTGDAIASYKIDGWTLWKSMKKREQINVKEKVKVRWKKK